MIRNIFEPNEMYELQFRPSGTMIKLSGDKLFHKLTLSDNIIEFNEREVYTLKVKDREIKLDADDIEDMIDRYGVNDYAIRDEIKLVYESLKQIIETGDPLKIGIVLGQALCELERLSKWKHPNNDSPF